MLFLLCSPPPTVLVWFAIFYNSISNALSSRARLYEKRKTKIVKEKGRKIHEEKKQRFWIKRERAESGVYLSRFQYGTDKPLDTTGNESWREREGERINSERYVLLRVPTSKPCNLLHYIRALVLIVFVDVFQKFKRVNEYSRGRDPQTPNNVCSGRV